MKSKKKKLKTYKYVVIQDNLIVAQVEGTNKKQVLGEINHYAWVYSQDGSVRVEKI